MGKPQVGQPGCLGVRALLLAGLCILAALAVVPAPAAAADCFRPPVLNNTVQFVCGRITCLEEGLPNIMVTCL